MAYDDWKLDSGIRICPGCGAEIAADEVMCESCLEAAEEMEAEQ